jgi:hypothetical protein
LTIIEELLGNHLSGKSNENTSARLAANFSSIEWLQLFQGKLEHVGELLLSDLNDLEAADFKDNICIDFFADTPQEIARLKQKLVDQCPPLEDPLPLMFCWTFCLRRL